MEQELAHVGCKFAEVLGSEVLCRQEFKSIFKDRWMKLNFLPENPFQTIVLTGRLVTLVVRRREEFREKNTGQSS